MISTRLFCCAPARMRAAWGLSAVFIAGLGACLPSSGSGAGTSVGAPGAPPAASTSVVEETRATSGSVATSTQSASATHVEPSGGPLRGTAPRSHENCHAQPDWVKNPSRPNGSTFDDSTNCAFHQWAFQTFLWLTSPISKSMAQSLLQLDTLASPYDLFPADGKGPKVSYPGRKPGAASHLLARSVKSSTSIDPTDIFQAGPGAKVLVDQKGQIVYYTMLLDKKYWDFVVDNKLFQVDALNREKPESKTLFPPDALELKLSWRVAAKLDAAGNDVTPRYIEDADQRFYVVKAQVPVVAVENGKVVEKGETYWAKIALVGMHVTGVVQGHPEFIWATFEHVDNAPDCDKVNTQKPGAGKEWSFYKTGTPDTQCNQTDPTAGLLASSSICRSAKTAANVDAKPCGNDGSQAQLDNDRNIFQLNADVRQMLDASSIWRNYVLVGSQWTTGASAPAFGIPDNNGNLLQQPGAPQAFQKGSCDLANTSMESFTQGMNCFACHNAGRHGVDVAGKSITINGKPINLSHFIVNYQAAQQTKPVK